ncbi:MAG: DUF72 domain-containing protein [Acidobacteriaceae bacterium]|nr:DUF72 domain-containing protein [Acidobacteriaceae bacterium]MBV9779666.1 DUF72 domain-containing protein [Acidobacteriaceae bacterium]
MIRIGPAGWAYKDWEGIVYPAQKPRAFHPLTYLAQYFDAIEINSSFYGAPRPSTTKTWTERVEANQRFRFTAKLYQGFTHKRNATAQDERDFKDGLTPLIDSGRFGALLLQFPWSFHFDMDNRQYLVDLAKRFREYPLVLEVRHASWAEPEVLDLLAELDIGLANIDQPLFKRSIKPGAEVTSPIGYIRLHGRNYKMWFSDKADVRERYDYLYKVDELEPWVTRIRSVGEKATDTYAMTNNHNLGKAMVNALEITSILRGKEVNAPASLVEHYPELREFTKTDA